VTIRQKVVDAAPLGRETVQNLEHFRFIEDHSVQDKNQMSITISGGKVLVVDDVETNLYVARGLLQPYGLTIECVKSGQEAIDRIRETKIPYDMVFMDHMMPEMDGIEATGIIRSMNTGQTRRLPVIALTANAIVGMREMFLGQGFNDYLSKPISRSKLDEILVRWIPPEKQQPIAAPDAADAPAAPTDLSIEGVDTSQGVAMLGGSRDGYLEVLGIFCQDAAQRLEGLRKTPGSGKEELHAFTTQVHALKSASASIGAAGVSQQAAALEAAGRNEDLGAIGEHLEKFCADLEALVHNIRAALQVESAAAPAEDGEGELSEPLRELFTQLRQALEEQEIRPIDLLLEKLKAVNAGASLKQTIAAISGSVLVSEFAEAIAIIDAVLT
jgi:CheY-like chemotaxis protein